MSRLKTIIIDFIFILMRFFRLGKIGLSKDFIKSMELGRKTFITYRLRPFNAAAINSHKDIIKNTKKLAIIIQGPISTANEFTLETVRLYNRHFNEAIIILSTWDSEDPALIKGFVETGITVLLNKKPSYAGESNINLQIVSSSSGVEKARELGAEYAMKTRTDQRMYAPDIADYLYNMTETFPLNNSEYRQKKRIVGISLNTFKYRMYGLSDMLIYGHIDDMVTYWSADLDHRIFNDEQRQANGSTLRKFANWRICEVYLNTEFLTKIGRNLKWTLKDSWDVFADHFCIVDKEQLDLFWNKYERSEHARKAYTCEGTKFQELTFRDWLNVYKNLNNRTIPEDILDKY